MVCAGTENDGRAMGQGLEGKVESKKWDTSQNKVSGLPASVDNSVLPTKQQQVEQTFLCAFLFCFCF